MTNEIMKVTQDESGLEYIEIDNDLAEAKIASKTSVFLLVIPCS